MSELLVISVLCLLFGINVYGQNEFGETIFQEALRWNYTHMNPTCTGPNGGRNPCTDIRICTFAAASLAIGGWPTLCGWVGKGVPKVCCGLPLVFGHGLMKKVNAEILSKKECGTTIYSRETETTKRFFAIADSLPKVNTSDPNKFDPPLDLEVKPMLIPPSVYSGSQQGNFPWMVSIRQNGSHLCGGSLIDRKHVLTAASCVLNEDHYTVHVGNLYVDDGYLFHVNKTVIHPQYKNKQNYKNLAILTLSEEILSPNVAHICLPGPDSIDEKLKGTNTTLLQWSENIQNDETRHYLKVIDGLTVVPMQECQSMCNNDVILEEFGEDLICTKSSDDSVKFEDDIGGPLMHKDNSRVTIIAVDNIGHKCGNTRLSRLFTRVSSNMNWIEEVISE